MIQSMTGYGKATAVYGNKKITAEIRSLNSKSIDIGVRTTSLFREKEMEIRSMITSELERGKVDFTLILENENNTKSLPINIQVFESYLGQIKSIADKENIPLPSDWFATILRMPEILTRSDQEDLTDQEWEVARTVIFQAIENLVSFRKQEGSSLEKIFRKNLNNIQNMLNSVSVYEKERIERIKDRDRKSVV